LSADAIDPSGLQEQLNALDVGDDEKDLDNDELDLR